MTTNVSIKALEQLRSDINEDLKALSLMSGTKSREETSKVILHNTLALKSGTEARCEKAKAEIEENQKLMKGLDIKTPLQIVGGSYSDELGKVTLSETRPVNVVGILEEVPGFFRDPARNMVYAKYMNIDVTSLKSDMKKETDPVKKKILEEFYDVSRQHEVPRALGARYTLK